jgi:hypothetical protein
MTKSWKRVAAGKVARLTPQQARDTLARMAAVGLTIHQPDVRALTGGFNSQAINFHVARLLGKRAGMIR